MEPADRAAMAIETVAYRVIDHALEMALEMDDWGNFPDIGERDWEAVVAQARELVGGIVSDVEFYDAYMLLSARAESVTS